MQFETYYPKDQDAEQTPVRAAKVDEETEVQTIGGPQTVRSGYAIERDRPGLYDVVDVDTFEESYSTQQGPDEPVNEPVDEPLAPVTDASVNAYDPGQHTVAEVNAFLSDHPEQRDAVLARERGGQNRTSLTG